MKKNDDNTISFTLDSDNPAPLTQEQKAELRALVTMPDEAIVYDEIPPLSDDLWNNATRGSSQNSLERQLTVRVDADVAAWLKAKGKDYQARMNSILRSAMIEEIRRKRNQPDQGGEKRDKSGRKIVSGG